MTVDEIIGANVRARRAFLKWKQTDLAGMLGWHGSMVSRLEAGKRSISVGELFQLAMVLHTSPEALQDQTWMGR